MGSGRGVRESVKGGGRAAVRWAKIREKIGLKRRESDGQKIEREKRIELKREFNVNTHVLERL